jgi:cellulose synthase/poly-beta-1,6-N-acetylglucosamine synthase-like glycosyltransferase
MVDPVNEQASTSVSDQPLVSVVIPCRNEGEFIRICLDSVLASDYPREKLEVFVVDGMSEDDTREIVAEYVRKYAFIRLLDNRKKIAPSALNVGIATARGPLIVRLDGHASIERDYISRCVKAISDFNADCVGGIMQTIPRRDTRYGRAIAFSLSHPFGVGNSYFRIRVKEPRLVDTVFAGCYKREVFQQIGGFNEALLRGEDMELGRRFIYAGRADDANSNDLGPFNEALPRGQDMEFSLRLKRAGRRTVLLPDIICSYYARSDMRSFWRHNWINGVWAVMPFAFSKVLPVSGRHLVPLAFLAGLIGSLALAFLMKPFQWVFLAVLVVYATCNLLSSLHIAWREREPRYLLIMPAAFAILHFGYGLGSLWGLVKAGSKPKFWSNILRLRWT